MSNLVAGVFHAAIYVQPIQFFLIITTNILNIRILCSRTLRLSPCTHYFIAYAVFSIIYACLLCPTLMLRGFSINWADGAFTFNLMLILASFDRYCSSSQSRELRSTSTIRIAKLTIVVANLLCALYMLPMIFIYKWDDTINICLAKSNTLINIYISSQVTLYYILSPLLMIVFGFLTISNIIQQRARLVSLSAFRRRGRIERQLARMLLVQVSVHLIFALPFGVIYTINSFKPSTQTTTVIGVRLTFVIWQQCDYFVSFFLYVLSGRVYRQKLIKILKCIRCQNTQVHPRKRSKNGLIHNCPIIYNAMLPSVGINATIR